LRNKKDGEKKRTAIWGFYTKKRLGNTNVVKCRLAFFKILLFQG
jgi:hypothetical protein